MFADLKEAWRNVNSKHDLYVNELTEADDNVIKENDAWITDLQERLYDVEELCARYSKGIEKNKI